jgi:single-stranded-DNA-specific exonuclease
MSVAIIPRLSVRGRRWELLDPDPTPPRDARELLVRLLRLRGIGSSVAARGFLEPRLPATLPLLPNLTAAVDRLAGAIERRERIAVFGDYDADGTTATAILVEGITRLGGVAIPYIPDRQSEGYGLNTGALGRLIDDGVTLVVTVDTGTSAVAEVAYAADRAVDVIVVDHHLPKAELPAAVAVVNPHLDHEGIAPDLAHLSGCGVAFMVLAALNDRLGGAIDLTEFHDLVAIGTVCDVVPLHGANRALVASGLKQLEARARPGLAALIDGAGLRGQTLTTESIAFRLGPRINAAGRLAHASLAYELLVTRDPARALELAAELERLNSRRQELTEAAMIRCLALVESECAGAPLIMVGDGDIAEGIAGLAAAKLAERYYRPVVVYRRGAEFSVASARSIPELDIHAALAHGAHIVERYGGHHQAGGFTVRTERLEELRRALTEWAAAQLDWAALTPRTDVDLELPAGGPLTLGEIFRAVEHLHPCGAGNTAPLFVARRALVHRSWTITNGKHLRLRLASASEPRGWDAIGFNLGPHLPAPGERIDLVYAVARDRDGSVRVEVKDLERDAGSGPHPPTPDEC